MMQYRKKEATVDAFRLGFEDIPGWFAGMVATGAIKCNLDLGPVTIPTREGSLRANYGDYIIRFPNGDVYPCGAYLFKDLYEGMPVQNQESDGVRWVVVYEGEYYGPYRQKTTASIVLKQIEDIAISQIKRNGELIELPKSEAEALCEEEQYQREGY